MNFKHFLFISFLFFYNHTKAQNPIAFGVSAAPLLSINFGDSLVFPLGIGGNIGGLMRFDLNNPKKQTKVGYIGFEAGAYFQVHTMNVIAEKKLFWSVPFEFQTPFLFVANVPYKKLPKFLKDKKRDLSTALGLSLHYLPYSAQGGYRIEGRTYIDYYYFQYGAGLSFVYSVGFEKLTKDEFVGVKLQWTYRLYNDNSINVSTTRNGGYNTFYDIRNHCLSLQFYALVREFQKADKKPKQEPLWVDENPYIPEEHRPEEVVVEKNPFPRIRSVRTL